MRNTVKKRKKKETKKEKGKRIKPMQNNRKGESQERSNENQ